MSTSAERNPQGEYPPLPAWMTDQSDKPKAYIAGPMRGYPGYNFSAFFHCARVLVWMGHLPLNPATWDDLYPNGDAKYTYEWYMRRDIKMIAVADLMVMLPGWRKSQGATFERRIAQELKMPVFAFKRVGPDEYDYELEDITDEQDE